MKDYRNAGCLLLIALSCTGPSQALAFGPPTPYTSVAGGSPIAGASREIERMAPNRGGLAGFSNDRPFGDKTIAVVRDVDHEGMYAFRSNPDGAIVVLEALAGHRANGSRIDAGLDVTQMAMNLLGSSEQAAALLDRLAVTKNARSLAEPLVIKVDMFPGDLASDSTAMNGSQQAQCYPNRFPNPAFYEFYPWWDNGSDNFCDDLTCGQGGCNSVKFWMQFPVGWSQRTSQNYNPTTSGACAAYGSIRSCENSYTQFQLLWRDNGGASWTVIGNYLALPEWRATYKSYANDTSNPCDGGDLDHYRYRADSFYGDHFYGYEFVRNASCR